MPDPDTHGRALRGVAVVVLFAALGLGFILALATVTGLALLHPAGPR